MYLPNSSYPLHFLIMIFKVRASYSYQTFMKEKGNKLH